MYGNNLAANKPIKATSSMKKSKCVQHIIHARNQVFHFKGKRTVIQHEQKSHA